jgi:putrescine aminotransferase
MTASTDRDTASTVSFRVAASPADDAAILKLRDAVYVRDQGRLADARQTASTFDRYDLHAVYILADDGSEPVGTIKVIPDSPIGLPCDKVADVSSMREHGRLVEFGHLMTLPRVRSRLIGMALMRRALIHSVQAYGVTHILGDFFVDDTGQLRDFYTGIGFVALGAPYEDARFTGAPLSVVAVLDIADAVRQCRSVENGGARNLRYFFGDYDEYARAK